MENPIQLTLIGVFIALSLAQLGRLYLRRRRRKENPKDYAFYLHERFGSTLGLPPIQRIRKGFPHLPEATMMEWLGEFEKVGISIGSLAQRGGTQALKWEFVKSKLQDDFPFLQNEGLRQAMFLVDYIAWHDGYLPE